MKAARRDFPRPLTEREAATLRFMLSPDDPRLAALREQAQVAMVTGMCECGCATIYLDVDRGRSRPAAGLRSPATDTASRDGVGLQQDLLVDPVSH